MQTGPHETRQKDLAVSAVGEPGFHLITGECEIRVEVQEIRGDGMRLGVAS
jgi:hypothetical protein